MRKVQINEKTINSEQSSHTHYNNCSDFLFKIDIRIELKSIEINEITYDFMNFRFKSNIL